MSKRERQAMKQAIRKAKIEGIKMALGSVVFIALSIAYMLYAVWTY